MDGGVGDRRGIEGDVGHLSGIVTVAIGEPQLRIREVHGTGDLLEQLPLGDLIAVIALELQEHALLLRHGARDEAAVLLEVELAFGLELGTLRQLLRRAGQGGLLNLCVGNTYSAFLVFLGEEDVRDHLVERVILNATLLIQGERLAASAFLLLANAVLRHLLELDIGDGSAVNLRDRGPRGHLLPRQPGLLIENKADQKESGYHYPDVPGGAPHALKHGT